MESGSHDADGVGRVTRAGDSNGKGHTNGHAKLSPPNHIGIPPQSRNPDVALLEAPAQASDGMPRLETSTIGETAASARAPLSLSVVIPTWNEAGNIGTVLQHLGDVDEIIIVDAFSDDGTVETALRTRSDVKVVQRNPRGKGDALRAGFEAATCDVIVIMDADGSMDPGEMAVFRSMISLGFDLVKGSRLACGGGSHDLTTIRWAGNAALCALANRLFRTQWTDLCYGYLAFRRDCLHRMGLTADGFEIEAQILGHAARAGLRIAEVPSIELPRLEGESHLNARRDGTRILKAMLAARFAPRARRAAAELRPLTLVTGLASTPRN
jgi:hypothetical protein